MKLSLTITAFFLFTISIVGQNGTYSCERQEFKGIIEEDNKEYTNHCLITIHIFGVGGSDYVQIEMNSKIIEENISYKWKIKEELQMRPDAKGKRIFRSYNASLADDNNEYQISIVKNIKTKKITVAAINADGSTWWLYDLEKIK